ncbi:MAG TPA: universal stress protein [Vicinamibacteria bacterium]
MGAALQDDQTARVAEAREYLARAAGRLAAREYAVRWEARVGAPARAIDAASHERGAALVVMATHGRTGLDRLLLGSVAEAVVRDGSAPVLLVRPPALRAATPAGGRRHAAPPARAIDGDEALPVVQPPVSRPRRPSAAVGHARTTDGSATRAAPARPGRGPAAG